MAKGVNKVILIGNLGRDPEVRYSQGGTAIANFSLATTERMKKGEEWTDQTEWHNIVVFGKMAENCQKYLAKGSTAYIEGRIQTRKWENKEGKERQTTEIVAQNVQFLGMKEYGGKRNQGEDPPDDDGDNSDCPF